MNCYLHFMQDIGLLDEVPRAMPEPGTVLARSPCFLHGGDNPNAFLLFADGFACETNKCHQDRELGRNLPGLIRHMVKRLTGEAMEWRAAWRWANANRQRLRELVGVRVRAGRRKRSGPRYVAWTREDLAACLEVPDPFYLSRGYKPETLAHFGVGRCVRPLPDRQYPSGWSVIPVYDGPDHLLGYTARNPWWATGDRSSKWRHAVQRRECLFNWWNAQVGRPDPVLICEGPGCVMRFHEAGCPHAVATLGSSMSLEQKERLMSLEQRFIIAADADDAGRKYAKQLRFLLGERLYDGLEVVFPPDGYKDFGDMQSDDLAAWLWARSIMPKLTA
jgi:hypothetical protein